MASTFSLTCYKGEDVTVVFTPVTVTDITGWTLGATLKAAPGDAAALLAVTGTILVAASGTFTVALTSAQTVALGAGLFYLDVFRTNFGSLTALAVGRLEVLPDPRFGE